MLEMNDNGILKSSKIIVKQYSSIEHGSLNSVHAIVIHQTGASTAKSTFNSYITGKNGAHFLIDKDGQIYQTASLKKRCYHVGPRIRSKCLTIDSNTCDSAMLAKIKSMGWTNRINTINTYEREKNYPDRYPVNNDSIAIELVGKDVSAKKYEAVTAQQNTSLQWLVGELYSLFNLSRKDVYRHPEISYKNPGEAENAKW